MKKLTFTACLLLLCSVFAFADDAAAAVDMDFLSKAKRETYIEDTSDVSWKNYNTGKQIRDMGRRLGAEVRFQAEENKSPYPFSSGYPDYKYKAARVFPGNKAGADVVYIGRRARVGTFKNLNRVLSGYIEKAYGVSMEDADQIALKVCYWNTNHYNDRAYFRTRFEHRVLEVFENRTKTLGLARSYKNWPGNARVVIPFTIVKEIVPEAVEPVAAEPEPEVEALARPDYSYEYTEEAEPEPVRPAVTSNTVKKEPAKKGLFPSPLLFALLGAAVLLLAVLIIFFASRKKD